MSLLLAVLKRVKLAEAGKKKQVVMGKEMKKKGIILCHASQISGGGSKQLKHFLKSIVRNTQVRTDKCRGYTF